MTIPSAVSNVVNPLIAMFQRSQPAPAPSPAPNQALATPPAGGLSNPPPPAPVPEPINPLDAYHAMMTKATATAENTAPVFQIDPATVGKVASSMDFTKGIPPELMTRFQAGDPTSMMEMMNHVGRQAYATALEHNTALANSHLDQRSAFETNRINQGVKSQMTNDALASNPAFQNPVVKQELLRIAKDLQKANPEASPADLAASAQQYFTEIYSTMNPAKPAPKAKEEQSLDDFFANM